MVDVMVGVIQSPILLWVLIVALSVFVIVKALCMSRYACWDDLFGDEE